MTKPTAPSFSARAVGAKQTAPLAPLAIARREPGPQDVHIQVLYCGVCHSDLHQVRDEWHEVLPTVYPCVPGHEVVGRVARVGAEVARHKVGDLVAVGCMVDSCRTCSECEAGLEQYCKAMPTFTYNFPDKFLGGVTYGGYSDAIVVDQAFVLKVPKGLDPAAAAPLLCAGITTWSPLRHWGVGPGKQVGIVGLGGLGHMGVKFARALGAHVVVFSTSPGKAEDARRLGAHEVVISRDADAMLARAGSLDFVLNTVSAPHDLNAYLDLLVRDGTMVMVGAPPERVPLGVFSLLFGRRRLAGSAIGGIRETQEMLDFCGQHGIVCDVEQIAPGQVNQATSGCCRATCGTASCWTWRGCSTIAWHGPVRARRRWNGLSRWYTCRRASRCWPGARSPTARWAAGRPAPVTGTVGCRWAARPACTSERTPGKDAPGTVSTGGVWRGPWPPLVQRPRNAAVRSCENPPPAADVRIRADCMHSADGTPGCCRDASAPAPASP